MGEPESENLPSFLGLASLEVSEGTIEIFCGGLSSYLLHTLVAFCGLELSPWMFSGLVI